MSVERKKTLVEFCNSNCFTDSEEDSSDEDTPTCDINDLSNNIIIQQPGCDKITIIVDKNNIIQSDEHEWENIEFAELDDVIFDGSLDAIIKEKQL